MYSSSVKFSADQFLVKSIQKRTEQNAFRELTVSSNLIDFCSNDYLGFARSIALQDKISSFKLADPQLIGSTGSRLLSGNSKFAEELEARIASYHQASSGLLYNSGYDANIGLFSAVAGKGDTIIYDELVHASIHDGIRLSLSDSYLFKHNDLEHLEQRMKLSKGNIFVAVESIYSMDGDYAPLKEIVALCIQYNANLIVDEAHATGVVGEGGKGRVVELGIGQNVFARVHTFGKALGCHGAIVLGSELLRDFLINFSRSFIYTSAMPFHSLKAVNCAYDILSNSNDTIFKTNDIVNLFKQKIKLVENLEIIDSFTPIQCLVLGGNLRVKKLAKEVQKSGYDVRPILSPTVQKGKERLRICIHAFNTQEQVIGLINSIAQSSVQIFNNEEGVMTKF